MISLGCLLRKYICINFLIQGIGVDDDPYWKILYVRKNFIMCNKTVYNSLYDIIQMKNSIVPFFDGA